MDFNKSLEKLREAKIATKKAKDHHRKQEELVHQADRQRALEVEGALRTDALAEERSNQKFQAVKTKFNSSRERLARFQKVEFNYDQQVKNLATRMKNVSFVPEGMNHSAHI
jgi:hypothetical protein